MYPWSDILSQRQKTSGPGAPKRYTSQLKKTKHLPVSLYPGLTSFLSSDQCPPPFMIRNKLPKSMAQSVRLPCIITQKPSPAKTSDFVVAIATNMIMGVGIPASLVSKPIKINTPQTISKAPTNAPRNSGDGNPIFSNRPAPRMAGKRIFECLLTGKPHPPSGE